MGSLSARPRQRGWAVSAAIAVAATATNRNGDKAMDVTGGSTADGARITQWTRHDGTNQQFQFVDSGGDYNNLPWRMGLLTQTNSTC